MAVRPNMIRRLLAPFFGPPADILQKAAVLLAAHGPQGAWLIARDKGRLAEVVDAEAESRHWKNVMREIERQTGYQHQPDTRSRSIDP